MYITGRPTFLESIPAIAAGFTAQSLEPKLPPAGTGCRSSLCDGIFSVPASMNR